MSQFNIDEIEKRTLSGLKDFQRATVERVDYLFRHNQNRVLVADEVGMGKTLIARGAIVKTARLRIEEKDDLFKVIYICSNQNIANQNIRKLDVTGKNAIGSVSDTRLSMQHLKITEQENDPQIKEGFIQLIPLTPETSFRMTTGGGSVQERALMYAILRRMPDFKGHATSLEKFMIMDAVKAWDGWAKWNFENRVAECEKMTKGVYPQNVIEKILNYQEYESIRDLLLNHLHERRYNKQLTYSNYYVMNKLRVMFARISVSMLEPDLVIMDEFQRFKFLLSSDDSELGILAHSFLSGHDTRVLLLSATPYKLYSTLEEIDENQLDEHYAEFFQVMNFLFDDEVKDIKFKEVWKNYSHALSELKAGDSAIIRMKELAENAMYQGVSRTERISVMDSGDYTDDSSVKHHLQIDENDINSYIQMSRLLSKTDSNHSLPVDYAKSCPYLMSFMKKYKIKEQIEKYYTKYPDEFGSEREQSLLWLNRNKINKYDELPKTNARLEALKEKAFTGGAEKYLWIPPSLPYYEMQGAYKNSKGFSKILVFSAWEMVPRMIGALVSYEAERLTVGKLVHQIKNQDKKNTGYFAEGYGAHQDHGHPVEGAGAGSGGGGGRRHCPQALGAGKAPLFAGNTRTVRRRAGYGHPSRDAVPADGHGGGGAVRGGSGTGAGAAATIDAGPGGGGGQAGHRGVFAVAAGGSHPRRRAGMAGIPLRPADASGAVCRRRRGRGDALTGCGGLCVPEGWRADGGGLQDRPRHGGGSSRPSRDIPRAAPGVQRRTEPHHGNAGGAAGIVLFPVRAGNFFVDPVKKACNLERYMLSSQMRLWIYHGDE